MMSPRRTLNSSGLAGYGVLADARGARADTLMLEAVLPDPRLWLALAFGLCIATRLWFCAQVPLCAEDAYITFRYAFHWGHGLGPVFNPGEQAWGFTSALWTSLLAAASALGVPLESFARGTLIGCDLLALWSGYRLLQRESPWAGLGFAFFFALWPRLAHMPATGLESSLVTALLLTTAAYSKSRFAGVLNGLLALSRPEGLAMSVLLLPLLRPKQRVVWLGVAALNAAFMLYFGQLAPSSMASKATVYGVQWMQGLYWMEWLIPGMPPRTDDGVALAPIAVLLLAGLVAVAARWRRTTRFDLALPLVLTCGLLTLLGYTALGVPWAFWYAPTPMVAILLAVFAGLGGAGVLRWTLAPLAVAVLFAWGTAAPRVVSAQTHDAAVFQSIGETLRADARDSLAATGDPSVMLEPIGIVGWFSELRVVDEVGLVTPRIARERRAGDGWYARVLAHEKPTYMVIRRNWLAGDVAWAGLGAPFVSDAQRDSALADYEPVRARVDERLPAGSAALRIYRRVAGR